ncbi:hypothetical protein AVEN_184719-1 [Araneus ventricosus]|uniref:Reverse transcriptase domain-containing protein n=1 Tax=Araneus ventricosus TaxID=182803 RepID=A0A4Y2DVD0_ARAVE|nr:hypothetical protein AVEN_184719-1 [Araneus ventricosus]
MKEFRCYYRLIPDILARFREEFGFTADIRKAFLQISISKEDRDYLRFLWWENLEEKKLKVFRHTRVVLGVKSSPFLLDSVMEYLIEASKGFYREIKQILKQSFYVDNVAASLDRSKQFYFQIHSIDVARWF